MTRGEQAPREWRRAYQRAKQRALIRLSHMYDREFQLLFDEAKAREGIRTSVESKGKGRRTDL